MKVKMAIIAAVLAAAVCAPASAVLPDARGPNAAVAAENSPEMKEILRIRVENAAGGAVEVSEDGGASWTAAGKVLLAAGTINPRAYTASGWAASGAVAATAVNAIHIKVKQNEDRGAVFSLLPKDFFTPPADYKSFYSRNSSIITNIPAGGSIFGGAESPFIGSRVLAARAGSAHSPIAEDYVPAEGDSLLIVVERPVKYPSEIVFENRFGGFILIKYPGEEPKLIGQVLKPVAGVGRFEGSLYTDVGRIRANHTGVVCVSTSPVGEIGGFQIIPENHAMSAEMENARLLTQWMVVGPPGAADPSLEGVAPLFRHFIRPVNFKSGPQGKTLEQALGAFIVQARIGGGEWTRMPSVSGRDDKALKDVTHIRMLFPVEWKH
ncbi:MAG: hypothetical protein BWY28_00198 [bacterium ADurb.Bin236]|nr:MAG: hypothetical protein BWY28_00198 [bacterium ADurb.Bin236]HOY64215.1 hypothetical protein [bacterium]